MLTEEEVKKVKEALDKCQRPFFFFHDDPDGLASFLLFYKYKESGRGYCLKAAPHLTEEHARKPKEYGADAVFILDIAMADQEFIDELKVPVTWLDHHPVQNPERALYCNPRKRDNLNIPTPYLCWQVVRQNNWIAAIGCIGDWYYPEDLAEEFKKEYPDLLPEKIKTVEGALYDSPVGTFVNVMSFNLKGATDEVNTAVKIFTRIEGPYEIMKQETSKGNFLWKKYLQVRKEYEKILKMALKEKPRGNMIVFTYSEDKLSLTKDLANELSYRNPDKLIVLGRRKSGEVRCSLRHAKKELPKALEKALQGVQGYGGGHEHACGVAVKEEDFERFLDNFRRELDL